MATRTPLRRNASTPASRRPPPLPDRRGGGGKTTTGSGSDKDSYPSGTVEMLVGAVRRQVQRPDRRACVQGTQRQPGRIVPGDQRGANGALAAPAMAKAEPDGSMIAIQNASCLPSLRWPSARTSHQDRRLRNRAGVSRDDYVLVTNPASGYRTLEDVKNAQKAVRAFPASAPARIRMFDEVATAWTPRRSCSTVARRPDRGARQPGRLCLNTGRRGDRERPVGKLTPLAVFGPERIECLPDVPTAKSRAWTSR